MKFYVDNDKPWTFFLDIDYHTEEINMVSTVHIVHSHLLLVFNLQTISIVYKGWDAEVQVGDPPVDKVENVAPGPTVELRFNSLGVGVRGKLLPRVL